MSWLFTRVRSPSTCSRRRDCESATTVVLSRSFSAEYVRRSRCTLNVAEMIWRCCLESASDLSACAAPAATAALRLRLAEVLVERPDSQGSTQIARRRLTAAHRVVVDRARVVRHRVTGLDAELLEVQRVSCRDLGQTIAARKQL